MRTEVRKSRLVAKSMSSSKGRILKMISMRRQEFLASSSAGEWILATIDGYGSRPKEHYTVGAPESALNYSSSTDTSWLSSAN